MVVMNRTITVIMIRSIRKLNRRKSLHESTPKKNAKEWPKWQWHRQTMAPTRTNRVAIITKLKRANQPVEELRDEGGEPETVEDGTEHYLLEEGMDETVGEIRTEGDIDQGLGVSGGKEEEEETGRDEEDK